MQFIVKRKLNDYEAWRKVVSEADGMRGQYGSRGATVYRSATDPNEVYLVFDWDDRKSYREYFDLPDVQQALRETGTTEITEVSQSFQLSE